MTHCPCGEPIDKIRCPLCEIIVSNKMCPVCILEQHIQTAHPDCTIMALMNAIKIRANEAVKAQEYIADNINQLKSFITIGKNFILDVYRGIEATFQSLKLSWFGRKNEALRRSLTSLYNILEERVIFGLMAVNVEKDFERAFKMTLTISETWAFRDLTLKLNRSGSGCLIWNINADAYALTNRTRKFSRADKSVLEKITPVLQEYSIGMWPVSLILTPAASAGLSKSKVDSNGAADTQSQVINDGGIELEMNGCISVIDLEENPASSYRHAKCMNNILINSITAVDTKRSTESTRSGAFKALVDARGSPHACRGYFMVYPDIVMSDTTSLFGAVLSEEESREHMQYDPIYQLCAGQVLWTYQTIATIISSIKTDIASMICDVVVLDTLSLGQLGLVKNVKVHKLQADCPSLIERCYVESDATINGSANLFVTETVFGDDNPQTNISRAMTIVRFSIFDGATTITDIRFVANCLVLGQATVCGQGVYVSCYFAHLRIDKNFIGQLINCHITRLETDPDFTFFATTFYKCVGPGLLKVIASPESEAQLFMGTESSDSIMPEDIDLEFILAKRKNAYTQLIEKNPAVERMDNALEHILAREFSNSAMHVQREHMKSNAKIAVDANLSIMDNSSMLDESADILT